MSKRVLNMFWVNFFEKFYLPCVPWRVESSKIFKKIKNFSKLQKCPKSFPKVSKRVLNMFWGDFSEKVFLLTVPWRVELSKIFKNPKKPKIVPKNVQTCFEYVLGRFFRKSFFAQCSLEGRVVEKFQKNQKFSKIQKCPKSLSKVSKRVLNMFWVNFFEKVYLPCVPWRVESSKIFKKVKNF